MEAQIILATLAQRFRLELVPGYPVKPDPTFGLRPLGGLLLRLHLRTVNRDAEPRPSRGAGRDPLHRVGVDC